MMFIYTLLTTATLAATTISDQAPVSHDGLERSCQRVDQSCKGFTQGEADSRCCSKYCHVLSVNKFGRMRGICEQSCKLDGQTCSGKSQKRADAKCCSGICNVLSVDADLHVYGECQEPPCQPLGASCQGRTFGEADSQCCSNRCDYLVQDKFGVYHGHCYRSFTALDGVAAAERTIVEEQPEEEKSTSTEGAPTPVANPIVANPITTPVANPITDPGCALKDQYCSGASQADGDMQCCSGYCKFTVNEYHYFTGTCQDRPTQGNLANPITTPVTKPSASCQRVDQSCSGFSQDQVNAQCCSEYCHVMSVDRTTGRMLGVCETSCQLVGNTCSGPSQYLADAECCSGSCDVLSVDKEGTHFGHCVNENVGKLAVVPEEKAAVANDPGSCRKNDRPCWGFSQGESDEMCCSAYCHVLEWDRDTGKMNGRCESYCELRGASCSGKSQIKADAKCCSGSCAVEGVDEKGKLYGTCDKATPVCKPVTAKCSGKHINDADAQCCSGNCGRLVFFDGEYRGRCTFFGEDGDVQPETKSQQQNSAGEA